MSPREIVTSRANPAVKRLRALLAGGAGGPLAVLEGFKLAEDALAAGMDVVEVAVVPEVLEGPHAALVRRLEDQGAAVRIVAPAVMRGLSETETSQGLLAIARRPSFDEQKILAGVPLVLVAVAVQNPGNLGALLRTAEAAGATGAYLTAGGADPMSWKALRGAMGSAFRLPHVAGLPAGDALDRLERAGVTAVAADADASDLYDAVDLTRPVALLFGNEGGGLPPEAASRARVRVRIPMAAPVESLNVGVAAGILFFEAARQRRSTLLR